MYVSVIYRRTEAGSQALSSANADMPRLVKQLLLLINGKNDANSYAQGLTGYGDVYKTLAELEVAGYIQRVEPSSAVQSASEQRKSKSKKDKDDGVSEFGSADKSWTTIFTSRLSPKTGVGSMDTNFENTTRSEDSTDFEPTQSGAESPKPFLAEKDLIGGFEVFDINKSLKQQSQAALGIAAAAAVTAPVSRLDQAVAEISSFIIANIGADGQEMVSLISAFRTEEELYAFLPRYEAGLMRRGLAVDAHFDRIEWILSN